MTDTDAPTTPQPEDTTLEDRRPTDPGVQPGADHELAVRTRSQRQLIVRRFLQHRLAMVSLFVLVFLVIGSLIGGSLWKYDYAEQLPEFNEPPTWEQPDAPSPLIILIVAAGCRGRTTTSTQVRCRLTRRRSRPCATRKRNSASAARWEDASVMPDTPLLRRG